MNIISLTGRLTKDPEIKETVTRYRLAVERRFKRDGEADTDYINVVTFGKGAEFAGKYFKKGMKVAVTGRLQTGSYLDKNGSTCYFADVVADNQEFCEKKQNNNSDGFEPFDLAGDLFE